VKVDAEGRSHKKWCEEYLEDLSTLVKIEVDLQLNRWKMDDNVDDGKLSWRG
jgi:hypothetical protein